MGQSYDNQSVVCISGQGTDWEIKSCWLRESVKHEDAGSLFKNCEEVLDGDSGTSE